MYTPTKLIWRKLVLLTFSEGKDFWLPEGVFRNKITIGIQAVTLQADLDATVINKNQQMRINVMTH